MSIPLKSKLRWIKSDCIFLHSGNGYIEGTELDDFLREFVTSVNASDCGPEVSFLLHKKEDGFQKHNKKILFSLTHSYDNHAHSNIYGRTLP